MLDEKTNVTQQPTGVSNPQTPQTPQEPQKQEKPQKQPKQPKPQKPKFTKEESKILRPNFFRSRIFIGATIVIVSALIAFVAAPIVQLKISKVSDVAVISPSAGIVRKGEIITSDMVKIKTQPISTIGNEVFYTTVGQVTGKIAQIDLMEGDRLSDRKVSDSVPFADEYLYDIPEGKQAITVTIPTSAAGLSDKLRPGDVVTCYAKAEAKEIDAPVMSATYDTEEDKEGAIYFARQQKYLANEFNELKYVEVLAVTAAEGKDVDNGEKSETDVTDETGKKEGNETITLLVDNLQARLLIGMEQGNELHISLVCRSNSANKKAYLASQDEILKASAANFEFYEKKYAIVLKDGDESTLISGGNEVQKESVDDVTEEAPKE